MLSHNFPTPSKKINFQVVIGEEIERKEEEGEVELSLGLSLNGRFGVDPKRLRRCSSKPELTHGSTSETTMVRSFSLPVEWMKKRKEVQTLRRIQAKRMRIEKGRNFESQQGRNNISRSTTSAQTLSEDCIENQNPENEEMVRKLMSTMPCVSTTGEGPNGKRIRGLLYPNNNAEGVKIVCVCHGSCYSPAEFVKHAGGREVANPLQHILVTPSSLF